MERGLLLQGEQTVDRDDGVIDAGHDFFMVRGVSRATSGGLPNVVDGSGSRRRIRRVTEWVLELLGLLIGFGLLAKGAVWLVDGGSSLARKWRVSPLMIGLTVVAWGTSLPEVVVSGLAAWEGRGAMALGNVLGSNVANIGLVLGVSAIILPRILTGRVALREVVWLLGSLAILWAVCYDGSVTRLESGLLLAVFALYNFVLLRSPRGFVSTEGAEEHSSRRPIIGVIAGAVAIGIGAKLAMFGAEGLATRAGISEAVIGLTVIAVGTSLPELAAGIGSALRGHHDISFGNVIGSNVFNSLAVIGIAGMIRPITGGPVLAHDLDVMLGRDFPVSLAFALVLVSLPFFMRGRAGRAKGAFLLASYLAYIAWLFA
ncbi:MAG: calcium/sodium antiporter [Planctomycetota bacterium]|nr:MAG: calcium/sodium antiporter [Planctomycetota bacterium]